MADLENDVEFTQWFDATFSPRGGELPLVQLEALRSWARKLFATSGPVDRDVVSVAYQFDQLAVVEAAVALVIADLGVASPRVPAIDVDAYERGVRITVDDGFTEPSIVVQPPFDVAEATAAIVEYLREHLSQDNTVSFPKCSRHEHFHLHPIVDNGVAVWQCKRGDHLVAAIGQLL